MSFTPNNRLPLAPVYLDAAKPENITLVIRQGETIRQPLAVVQRAMDIISINPTSETQVSVTTRSNHCLKECDRIILNGVQCRYSCNDPNGCYEAGSITGDTSFLIEGIALVGDITATCAQCFGGEVLVPIDLTGTQVFAQIRQGHSAERYAPPIVAAKIMKDTSVLQIPDCEGCPSVRKGDFVDIPEAGIQAAQVIRLEKTVPRHCTVPVNPSCKAILDQVAAEDVCKTKVTLHQEAFAEFTSEVNDPRFGVIELVLPSSESQKLPIPWCEPITLAKPDGRAGFGPLSWDSKLKTQQGDFWLTEGAVVMLPSTTIA